MSNGIKAMKKESNVITRRNFLRAGTSAFACGLLGLPLLGSRPRDRRKKSRVILVRNKNVLDSKGEIRFNILEKMVDQGIRALTNSPTALAGWKQMFGPDDVVGIKSNFWFRLRTPKPLEELIQSRLAGAGVNRKNMSVDDRELRDNPIFQKATALINTRPLRTHDWAGLGSLIKNYIMFAPKPSDYHDNACERLGAVWQLPHVAGKTRLNILVMLTPLFHSIGPHIFGIKYTWPYKGIIMSKDPVAADATGARIIQARRDEHFGEHRPIAPPPLHIKAADQQFNLGNSHPGRIEIIKLGWQEGILI